MKAFERRHEKIVCIDSDGTALDTMNIKHIRCFGPCFVKTWGLEAVGEEALRRWNEINLYERTRGRNRFLTLLQILGEYNGKYLSADLGRFAAWVGSGKELSGKSIRKELAENGPDETLSKALAWSDDVNAEIGKLSPDEKKPFGGVEEFLKEAERVCDIAVVSSAGAGALKEEWAHFGLDGYCRVLFSQEDGTKAECLKKILALGYGKEDVVMAGDSFPDIGAAEECGVYFYPVLAGKEEKSWKEFKDTYLRIFTEGSFASAADSLKDSFYRNLNITE